MVTPNNILNARILVVDDKEANVRLIEGMLRIAGYTSVDSTTQPEEVGRLHRANRYGLILLDLQMPVMDGFAVMEELKKMDPGGYLPVLVITAQPGHKLRALEAGAKDFVSKPFDLAELRARVRNILEVRLYSEELSNTVKELEKAREALRIRTLEEQRLREQELSLAQRTQESLLPGTIPHFKNFDVQAYTQPTRYVGGDFYDFLQHASGEWTGVLADVSGKGMPAALLSALLLGTLSAELRSGAAPHEVLKRVNQLLCEKSLPNQFATLFQFLLNPNGTGTFISAAHNPGYIYRAATGEIEELISDSYFVGMFSTAAWRSLPFHLNIGDVLLVYSDGLTDAENPRSECFGEDRVLDVIRKNGAAGTVREGLLEALKTFTKGTPQSDDITFLVVRKTH